MEEKNLVIEKIKKFMAISIGLTIVGWFNAGYALVHRADLFENGIMKKSFCNISKFIDCDSVAFSRYSSIFGFPSAAWGMMFYALFGILLILTYFSCQDQKKEGVGGGLQVIKFFALINLIPTLAFAGISALFLKTLCLLCLLTYVINFALLFFAFKASALLQQDSVLKASASKNIGQSIRDLPQLSWFIMGILLLLHLLAPKMAVNMVSRSAGLDDLVLQQAMIDFRNQTAVNFDTSNAPQYGPQNAPITIVEFSDFQCPYCAMSAKTLPSLLKAYEGKIRFVFKNYPLDSSCNPKMERAAHPHACKAAKIGYCVFKSKSNEAFFAYKEKVFEKQQDITPELLMNAALESGASESEIKSCIEDSATHQYIVDNSNEGAAAKVEGTPSLYINGKKVETGPNPKVLTKLLNELTATTLNR